MDLPTEFLEGALWLLPEIVHVLRDVIEGSSNPGAVDRLSTLPTRYTLDRHPMQCLLGGARPSKGCRWHCYYPKNV